MWVYSIFPPNLSLIGPLTTEIYNQTGIAGTDTRTLKLILSGRVKKEGRINLITPSAHLLSLYLSLSLSPLFSLALSFHLLPFIFFFLLHFCSLFLSLSLSLLLSLSLPLFLSPLYEQRIKCVS